MVVKAEKTVGYKWKVDFNGRAKHSWHNPPNLANPIGYCDDFERVPDHEQDDNNAHLIVKRSWDIALVPIKQVIDFMYYYYIFNMYDCNLNKCVTSEILAQMPDA